MIMGRVEVRVGIKSIIKVRVRVRGKVKVSLG